MWSEKNSIYYLPLIKSTAWRSFPLPAFNFFPVSLPPAPPTLPFPQGSLRPRQEGEASLCARGAALLLLLLRCPSGWAAVPHLQRRNDWCSRYSLLRQQLLWRVWVLLPCLLAQCIASDLLKRKEEITKLLGYPFCLILRDTLSREGLFLYKGGKKTESFFPFSPVQLNPLHARRDGYEKSAHLCRCWQR